MDFLLNKGWLNKKARKHRAPKGALRPPGRPHASPPARSCRKAPSAKRCIKTRCRCREGTQTLNARKHRAPKGALRLFAPCLRHVVEACGQKAPSAKRCIKTYRWLLSVVFHGSYARKHRAPKGALRQHGHANRSSSHFLRQKAPSAKRCIKTARWDP